MKNLGDSDISSEVDDQTKNWESEPLSLALSNDYDDQSKCGIGHRVVASRSVLTLALDDDCVYAGLQGGDILVSIERSCSECIVSKLTVTDDDRHGPLRPTTSCFRSMLTAKVSWRCVFLMMDPCSSPVVEIQ